MSDSRADFDQLIEWKRAQLIATNQTDLFKTAWVMRLISELFETRDETFGGGLYTLHLGDKLAAVHLHLRGQRHHSRLADRPRSRVRALLARPDAVPGHPQEPGRHAL
jgi:CelD/BcsL family acetyltransferase involved in cellulose biosynthesis